MRGRGGLDPESVEDAKDLKVEGIKGSDFLKALVDSNGDCDCDRDSMLGAETRGKRRLWPRRTCRKAVDMRIVIVVWSGDEVAINIP